jgi:hypothetical protein
MNLLSRKIHIYSNFCLWPPHWPPPPLGTSLLWTPQGENPLFTNCFSNTTTVHRTKAIFIINLYNPRQMLNSSISFTFSFLPRNVNPHFVDENLVEPTLMLKKIKVVIFLIFTLISCMGILWYFLLRNSCFKKFKVVMMAACTWGPSYLGGWGRKISWR